MKKILFALPVMALCLGTVACSEKEESNKTNESGEITALKEPAFKKEAKTLKVSDSKLSVEEIVLGESGVFVLKERAGEPSVSKVTIGDYVVEAPGKYSLKDKGNLVITDTKATVDFVYTKTNGEVESGTATIVTGTSSSSVVANNVYRTWTVTKTRISIADGVKANADFNGCDLQEIVDFLKSNGVNIKDDVQGRKVKTLTLTQSGKFIIAYTNGLVDMAESTLTPSASNGKLSYSWDKATTSGWSFEDGSAEVAFDKEYCILTLGADIKDGSKNYKTSVALVLKDAK